MHPVLPGDHVLTKDKADNAALEELLLGTSDPREIAELVADYCHRILGVAAARYEFYAVSVGAVHGLTLADGRRVVVKLHRPEVTIPYLMALQELQRHARERGLPAPRPLAPATQLRNALVTAESMMDDGYPPNADDASHRDIMARGLARFVEACRDFPNRAALHSWFEPPVGTIWPPPHDLRFDFPGSTSGAEWIDAIAARALERVRQGAGDIVVGHDDWRRENLRISGPQLGAIYDWDSVRVTKEPAIVANAMRTFPADWSAGPEHRQIPTLVEMHAFLSAYEEQRGQRFCDEELLTLRAAIAYGAAYTARCEHSDRCTDFGRRAPERRPPEAPAETMSAFLREHGEELLSIPGTSAAKDRKEHQAGLRGTS